MPARVPPIDPARYTPDQQRAAAQIAGARGNVRGPFTIWLRNPKLAEHVNQRRLPGLILQQPARCDAWSEAKESRTSQHRRFKCT